MFAKGMLMDRKRFETIWKELKIFIKEDQGGFVIYDHWFVVDATEEKLKGALSKRSAKSNINYSAINARVSK